MLLLLLLLVIILPGCKSVSTVPADYYTCQDYPKPLKQVKLQSELIPYMEKGRLAHSDCKRKLEAIRPR